MATSVNPSNFLPQPNAAPPRRLAAEETAFGVDAAIAADLHAGDTHHASVLKTLLVMMAAHEREWGIRVLPRHSVQVAPSQRRVADLIAVARVGRCEAAAGTTAPLLVVEILCDHDRMAGSRELIQDYVEMGVKAVWVIDPKRRRAYASNSGSPLMEQREDLTVEGTRIRIPVMEMFAELDEMEYVFE